MNPPSPVSLESLRQHCAEPLAQPEPEMLRACGQLVLDSLLAWHLETGEQPVGQFASATQMHAALHEPPPEEPSEFAEVFNQFVTQVAANTYRLDHPRFLAFIPSAPSFFSILGDVLCSGTNFFAGVWAEAAGPTQVELVVLDWFRQFLGLPETSAGILTSGGSEANLTALVVAREALSSADRVRAVLYVSQHRHWSIDRAARIMGLQPEQIHPVPAGADLKLQPSALLPLLHHDRQEGRLPWCVVANAGATSTGTVDPLAGLADVCAEHSLWLHADAAYGWAAVLGREVSADLRALGRAHSITFDPHKWLAQTIDVGGVFIREGNFLTKTFALRPDYMQDVEPDHDEVNFADRGLALTRRFRALKVWLSLKVLGVGWFRQLIDHGQHLAHYAEARLRQAEFEILFPPQLSIVCFRYRPVSGVLKEDELDQLNLEILEALRQSGEAFLSSTRLLGRVAIRFCFVNWRTTAADVDRIIDLLQELGNARNPSPKR